ncbi:flavodoxin [Methanobrevibacter filiformis]|uniref:Flavodoxin n=2 Tax=Methanobrevibacter filiformis TaxID=55758 RepID=A0A166DEU2_9EURY|nr:flavodoxin [Methanobrevibacter filiformis]
MDKKVLIIVHSYHQMNTMEIAEAFSKKTNAKIVKAQDFNIEEIENYDFIGFGSGIDIQDL